MNRVWSHSQQSGGPLLVLLAIADFADDDGVAYPGNEKLAAKARLTERQVRRATGKMVRDEELAILRGGGPNGRNAFQVLTGGQNVLLQPGQNVRSRTRTKCPPKGGHLGSVDPDISGMQGADILDTPPTPPYKADPSEEEPSMDPSVEATGADAPSTDRNQRSEIRGQKIPKTVKDPNDYRVWTLGVHMLVGAHHTEQQARSFLGKCIRDYGKPRTAWAVTEALAQDPIVAPLEYIQKILSNDDAERERQRARANVGQHVPAPVDPNDPWVRASNAIELAMSVEGLTLAQAIARLRDPEERGTGLEQVDENMLQMLIKCFVYYHGCVYEPAAEVA